MTILDLDRDLDDVAPATVISLHAPPPAPSPPPPRPDRPVRRIVVLTDAAALLAAWLPVVVMTGHPAWLAGVAVAAGLAWLTTHGLHRTAVCTQPFRETAEAYEAGGVSGLVVTATLASIGTPTWPLLIGSAASGVALHAGRRAWDDRLRGLRAQGHYLRRALVVGHPGETTALAERLTSQPSLGFVVTRTTVPLDPGAIADLAARDHVDAVLVSTGAVSGGQLTALVRRLSRRGVAVQLVGGLARVDPRRVAPVPLGRDTTMLVQPVALDGHQARVKRAFDVAVTGLFVPMLAPVLFAVALAVKLGDGGPVLFRQERVGRDGRLFTMLKFRSMVVDAEDRLSELVASNTRSGPLFKAANDPRVTPIGRVLRATSLDELPQLFNVLRGDMSLVGPRPALASEVTSFSDELLDRHEVPPGITGLWQVEGRDVPDFSAYEESDLYYVENWGVLLDVSILLRTARVVVRRGVSSMPGRREVVLD